MINDNKQSQRGSPLQRGPLLEPVPQTPNQPYNPLPPAGGGTVFTPGRTVFGRDYATPQESPLATLLGELPKVVDAIGSTVEQRKKWEEEDQTKLFNQTKEKSAAEYNLLLEKYPDGIPKEEALAFQRKDIERLASLDSQITNPKVRASYLSAKIQARQAHKNTTEVHKAMDTETAIGESTRLGQSASNGNDDSLSSFVPTSADVIRRLEEERSQLQRTGNNPERLRAVNNLLFTEREKQIAVASSYVKHNIDRLNFANPKNSEERADTVFQFIEEISPTLAEYGYTEDQISAIENRVVSIYLREAEVSQNSKQQRYLLEVGNGIARASDKDEDGSSVITRATDVVLGSISDVVTDGRILSPEGAQQLTMNRDALAQTIANTVMTEMGIDLSPDPLIKVGFSKEVAERTSRTFEQDLFKSIDEELKARHQDYAIQQVIEIQDQLDQVETYLSEGNYGDFTNLEVGGDSVYSLLERRNNLLPPEKRRGRQALLNETKEIIIRSMTRNPTVVAAITSGSLDSQEFRKEFGKLLGFEEDPETGTASIVRGSWADGMREQLTISNTNADVTPDNMLERMIVPQINAITQAIFKEVVTVSTEAIELGQLFAQDPVEFGKKPLPEIVRGLIALRFSNPDAIPMDSFPAHLRGAKTLEEALALQEQFLRKNNAPLDMSDSASMRFLALTSGVNAVNLIQQSNISATFQERIDSLQLLTPLELENRYIDVFGEELSVKYDPAAAFSNRRPAIIRKRLTEEYKKEAKREMRSFAPSRTIPVGTEETFGWPRSVFTYFINNGTIHMERFLSAENPEEAAQSYRIVKTVLEALRSSLGTANEETLSRISRAIDFVDADSNLAPAKELFSLVYPMLSGTDTVLTGVMASPETFQRYLQLRKETDGELGASLEAHLSVMLDNLDGPTKIKKVPTKEDLFALLKTPVKEGGLGVEKPNMLSLTTAVSMLIHSPFADKINREGFERSVLTVYELLERKNINPLSYAAERAVGTMTTQGFLTAVAEDISKDVDMAYHPEQGVIFAPVHMVWSKGRLMRSNEAAQSPLMSAQGNYDLFRLRYGLSQNASDFNVATAALWVSRLNDTSDPETTRIAMDAWASNWINDIMSGVAQTTEVRNNPNLALEIRQRLQGEMDAVFSRTDFMDLTFADITSEVLGRWEPGVFKQYAVFQELGYSSPLESREAAGRLTTRTVPRWNRTSGRFNVSPVNDFTREAAEQGFIAVGVSVLGDTNHENSLQNRLYRGGYVIPNVLIRSGKADRDYQRSLREALRNPLGLPPEFLEPPSMR